jgi:hypothetical protein
MGLYYKILRKCNVQEMDKFRSKLVSRILSVTNTLALTNTLAYYKIRTLRTHNDCIVRGQCNKTFYGRKL